MITDLLIQSLTTSSSLRLFNTEEVKELLEIEKLESRGYMFHDQLAEKVQAFKNHFAKGVIWLDDKKDYPIVLVEELNDEIKPSELTIDFVCNRLIDYGFTIPEIYNFLKDIKPSENIEQLHKSYWRNRKDPLLKTTEPKKLKFKQGESVRILDNVKTEMEKHKLHHTIIALQMRDIGTNFEVTADAYETDAFVSLYKVGEDNGHHFCMFPINCVKSNLANK